MANKTVQLIDAIGDNIFPVAPVDVASIEVTSTDPGAGSALAANHFVAVAGDGTATVGSADLANNSVTTAKIADDAVTADKFDFSSLDIKTGTVSTGSNDLGLTAGNWIIIAMMTTLTSGSNTPVFRLTKNGTTVIETYCGNEGASVWENLSLCKKVTVASGDTWALYTDNSAQASSRSSWIAIKISN